MSSTDNAIIRNAKRQILQEFRVAAAARVNSFARGAGRVVADLMTRLISSGLQPIDEPAAQDLPVIFPGGGGYGFFFDMRENDPAVLLCADGPVRGFYETGDAVTPGAGSVGHDYGSAVAFPGGRVSQSDDPTDPPNNAGEGFVGAVDGSAAVIFRGAGIPSPAEQGTVVVQAADKVLLGTSNAALGVVRLGDGVAPTADMVTFMTAVAGFINGLAPGTIAPPIIASISAKVGQTSEASADVLSV